MGTRKLAEYIIDLVLLLVGIALAVASQSIPPGSSIGIGGDFMPKVCTKIWIFYQSLPVAVGKIHSG